MIRTLFTRLHRTSRQTRFFLLLLSYLFPFLILVGLPVPLEWLVFLTLPFILGALLGTLVFRAVEERSKHLPSLEEVENLQEKMNHQSASHEKQLSLINAERSQVQERITQLTFEMQKARVEVDKAHHYCQEMREEFRRLDHEYRTLEKEKDEAIDHKDQLLGEYQKTIREQRTVLEKKHRYISKLEEKVRDLMYEIRSLVQPEGRQIEVKLPLPELEPVQMPPPEERTAFDLSLILRKYLKITSELLGAKHLAYTQGKAPRFADYSLGTLAIDQRYLFETLEEESDVMLFMLSLEEGRFLFVNSSVKTLFGWSPEKFMSDFPHLILLGFNEWEQAMHLAEAHLSVVIRHKQGEEIPCHCLMGLIPQGPFQGNILGLLAPSQQTPILH